VRPRAAVTLTESAMELLPAWSDIPDEFKGFPGNAWAQTAERWFFDGGRVSCTAKPDIDIRHAYRHLDAILRSWDPQHEHKIAGVAYLLSLWFESFEVRPAEVSP
jgi:hypothetical protein